MKNLFNLEGATLGLSFFKSVSNVTPQYQEGSLEDICRMIDKIPPAEHKRQLPLIVPRKFKGGRSNQNVVAITGIVGEHDAGIIPIERVKNRLKEYNIQAVVYASPNWRADCPKWRVIVPLAEPIETDLVSGHMLWLETLNWVLEGAITPECVPLSQSFFIGYLKDGHREKPAFVAGQCIDAVEGLQRRPIVNRDGKQVGSDGIAERTNDLTLDTLIRRGSDDPGKPLRDVCIELLEERRIRDLFPVFSGESSSGVSAKLGLTKENVPFFYESGTCTSHYLRSEDLAEWEELSGTGIGELVEGLKETARMVEKEMMKPGREMIPDLSTDRLNNELYYLTESKRYCWLGDLDNTYSKAELATALIPCFDFKPHPITGQMRKTQRFDTWLENPNKRAASALTFHPGEGMHTQSPDNGKSALNTWRPFDRRVEDYPEDWVNEKARPFVEHVEWLWGEDSERFLNWLAHIEQKPGERGSTHWLHISPYQGTGRSWIGSVLFRVWNPYVVPNLALDRALDRGGFNPEVSRKLLGVVEEINEGGSKKWAHAEALKDFCTTDKILINQKNEKTYYEYFNMRLLAFTQHNTGLPLTRGDRRFWVVKYYGKPKPFSYYKSLYRLVNEPDFIRAVSLFLVRRNIRGYDPNETPIVNEAKQELIDANASLEDKLVEAIESHWPRGFVSNAALKQLFEMATDEVFNKRSFANYMRHKSMFVKKSVAVFVGDRKISRVIWIFDDSVRKKQNNYFMEGLIEDDWEHTEPVRAMEFFKEYVDF